MDTPFPYDKFVTGKNFIGRKSECTVLSNLIAQHAHVALYEPPKTGKTSLIQQSMQSTRFTQRANIVGQFSVLNIRTIDGFLTRSGSTVILSEEPISSSTPRLSPNRTPSSPSTGTWTRKT